MIWDYEDQLGILVRLLQKPGYVAAGFLSAEDALEYLKNHSAHLLLVDMDLGKCGGGMETYEKVKKLCRG